MREVRRGFRALLRKLSTQEKRRGDVLSSRSGCCLVYLPGQKHLQPVSGPWKTNDNQRERQDEVYLKASPPLGLAFKSANHFSLLFISSCELNLISPPSSLRIDTKAMNLSFGPPSWPRCGLYTWNQG